MRTRILLSLLLSAGPAAGGTATPPGTGCSQVPARVFLVGMQAGIPDTRAGTFEVDVCRFGNAMANADVAVSVPDWATNVVRIGSAADPSPRAVSCALHFRADASGVCHITLTGSVDLAQVTAEFPPTVRIYAEGVLFGEVPVVCYDLDGAGGVGAGDLSVLLGLFGSGQEWSVADYNGNGRLDADDLSMWVGVFGGGAQTESAVPLCP